MTPQNNEFWNSEHEILFALFILEENHAFAWNYHGMWDYEIIQRVMMIYMNLWEDRAICEEPKQYEGWVSNDSYLFCDKGVANKKIRFHFVND
jgi:hypothetical protein